MKKNFDGFQVDGQLAENWHDNHDTIVQNLVRQFGYTPPTGTAKDGRNRSFDMLMGTNFADGKGSVTAFLSYRHADPVASSQRDFGACQLFPTTDANGNLNGLTCGGSSNSNWFQRTAGPNAGTVYSVSGPQRTARGRRRLETDVFRSRAIRLARPDGNQRRVRRKAEGANRWIDQLGHATAGQVLKVAAAHHSQRCRCARGAS